MTGIQPFVFPDTSQQVRTVMIDAEPWFVAVDVCAVLGIGNSRQALVQLDEDEKGVTTADTLGGLQQVSIVSEAGLYSLILRSRKPEAKAFKRWITHEVLPAIRRTGSYSLQPVHRLPQSYAEALRELASAVEQRDQANAAVAVLEPKAESWDILASADGDYSLRQAAQILDRDPAISTGQNRLAKYLKRIGWLDRRGIPYQKHVDARRLVARPRTYDHPRTGEQRVADPQIRITLKGLQELHRLLGGQMRLRLDP